MHFHISSAIRSVHFPPISEVREWAARRPDDGKPLIDLCQAVPDYPPAHELVEHLATVLKDPLTSKYSPDEGLPEVRAAVSIWYEKQYGAAPDPANICLTIGASQAFWLAMVTLCRPGNEVVVQAPYYFDHQMALDILGIRGVYTPFDEESGGLPSPALIESLISERTRAILLVTPSNPTGAITPPDLIRELYDLAVRRGIALVLDETYNAFIPGGSRPHDLFTLDGNEANFIHLASFGKTFALTGYRAGMLAAPKEFIHHALKAQDTMAVCAPRITQHAIAFGVQHLDNWVAGKREMMIRRHDLFRKEFTKPGNLFTLAASGGFFAWVRHPWPACTGRQAARRLIDEAAILCLPGEVFGPGMEGYLRLAFGNIREETIPDAVRRIRESAA